MDEAICENGKVEKAVSYTNGFERKVMTFGELKKLDKYDAFSEFESVIEAKNKKIIPEDYIDFFPEHCECGSEIIVKRELTQLQCCNPRCKLKMGYMLSEMLDRFGCKDIGPATCLSVMNEMERKLDYYSPVEMLSLPYEKYPLTLSGAKGDDFLRAVTKIRKTKLTLADLVAKLAIPTLEENGRRIFEAYSSVMDLLKQAVSEGGIGEFMEHRDIHDRMKMFYLKEFMEDIARAQIALQDNIRLKAFSNIDICITGSISPQGISVRNKREYIDYLNDIATTSSGERLIEIRMTSAKHSVKYIVADYASSSDKYRVGKEREVLITSTELMNQIREVVQEYEQQRGN